MIRSDRFWARRTFNCLWILLLFFIADGRRYDKCLTGDGRQGVCVIKRYCREASQHELLPCEGDDENHCCPIPTTQRSAPTLPPPPPPASSLEDDRYTKEPEVKRKRPEIFREPERDDRLNKTPPPTDRRPPPRYDDDRPKKRPSTDRDDEYDADRRSRYEPPEDPSLKVLDRPRPPVRYDNDRPKTRPSTDRDERRRPDESQEDRSPKDPRRPRPPVRHDDDRPKKPPSSDRSDEDDDDRTRPYEPHKDSRPKVEDRPRYDSRNRPSVRPEEYDRRDHPSRRTEDRDRRRDRDRNKPESEETEDRDRRRDRDRQYPEGEKTDDRDRRRDRERNKPESEKTEDRDRRRDRDRQYPEGEKTEDRESHHPAKEDVGSGRVASPPRRTPHESFPERKNRTGADSSKFPIRFPDTYELSVPTPKVPACGVKPYDLFIAGGQESQESEWPWMTAIFRRYPDSRPKTFLCGGSLINTKYVLTAAHCFVNNYVILPASSFVVRLGSHFLDSGEEYTVANLVIHHNHSGSDFFNDIALVRLASEVYITDKIAPICLPSPEMINDDFVGKLATVSGWGDTSFRASGTRILQHVTVPIVSGDECFAAYSRVRGAAFLARGSDHVICAGLREGGKDACLGDSGGPLMMKMPDDRWIVVGIVSLGYKCAEPGYPGVYTRVTHYMSWIHTNMKRR